MYSSYVCNMMREGISNNNNFSTFTDPRKLQVTSGLTLAFSWLRQQFNQLLRQISMVTHDGHLTAAEQVMFEITDQLI